MGLFNTRPQGRQPLYANGMQNYQPASYRRARAAISRVISGSGSAAIACVGDSNTRGTGSHTGAANGANAASGSQGYSGWPVKLAGLLNARGIKSQCENVFGAGGYEGAFATYDDRIVMSGAGATASNVLAVGGKMFMLSAAGSITFTTKTACTKWDLWFVGTASAGLVAWSVDGGSATTVSLTRSTTGLYKLTFDLGALSTHVVSLSWVSGQSYVYGFDCYDGSGPLLRIWNWGWHGSKTDDWWTAQNNSSPWSAKNAVPAVFRPDLIIGPALMTNDFSLSNNVPVATWKANMQGLLDAFSAQSDVLLLASGPCGSANAPTPAVQAVFNDAAHALAGENRLGLLDEYSAMGADQTAAEALGFIWSDHVHKTALGHAGTARMAANAILAMA